MTCNFCGGSVPLPEGKEETFCTQCGKAFRLYETEEIWFATVWEKYRPVDAD